MKILYGVQATGNGHITRARAVNKYLKQQGLDVDFLFSGRDRDQFFDMEAFGDWRCHPGMTFIHRAGRLDTRATIKRNSLSLLWRDIKQLDLTGYDLVLTDFEPITAWAARRQGKACVGLGHQYAFGDGVPKRGNNLLPRTIMKYFAPVQLGLGLHWHHFNRAILPPIAEVHPAAEVCDPNKIVVYLGFEEPEEVIATLEPFDNHLFVYYGPFPEYESRGHIQLKPLSREGFKQDLASASGVICNAGFELSSEAIQLGKKLLIKPLHGQMEQLSNAVALEQLGLGMTMDSLDQGVIGHWLENWQGKQVIYPDVAKAIVDWLVRGDWQNKASVAALATELWQQVDAPLVPSFTSNPLPALAGA